MILFLTKPSAVGLEGATLSTLFYSLFTRYELGPELMRVRAHLVRNGLSGVVFASAPAILRGEEAAVTTMLLEIGVFEISTARLTKPGASEG